jgi:hypothetical protein
MLGTQLYMGRDPSAYIGRKDTEMDVVLVIPVICLLLVVMFGYGREQRKGERRVFSKRISDNGEL